VSGADEPLVFISYRRADSSAAARWIADSIARDFGSQHVFIDTDSIRIGDAWPGRIDDALASATIVLPVIGPAWLRLADQYGRRRLDRIDDWVCNEIYQALQRRLHVIPLLLSNTPVPLPEALPERIKQLSDLQALELSDTRWNSDIATLLERLVDLGLKRTGTQPEGGKIPIAVEHHSTVASAPSIARRFQSNIPSRKLPFVGRDDLLDRIHDILVDPSKDNVVVLHGQAGVGKSELAREFSRRDRERYPGGTFLVDARPDAVVVELARIGRTRLGLDFPKDLRLEDQGLRTLSVLGEAPSLLIFDNAHSEDTIRPWLPTSGMSCHAMITSPVDCWDLGWPVVRVEPLSESASLELIDRMGGSEIPIQLRRNLAAQAQGLPVQIVPVCRTMRRAAGRGRIDSVKLTLTEEAEQSFGGVYAQLDPRARLLIHAAARLNFQRIICKELERHLLEGAGWSADEFEKHLDTCLDLTILEGQAELHMHQLFAAFILKKAPSEDFAETSKQIVQVQARRLIELASQLAQTPNRADLAGTMLTYAIQLGNWQDHDADFSSDAGATIGRALLEIGQFAAARPWFERAVAEKEKGDVHGRIDHVSLGRRLHQVGDCLSSTGEFVAARPWFERAVAEKEKGDVHGWVDHPSVGKSLHQVGSCLTGTGAFAAARPWFERAVAEKEKVDVHGLIDHESLGASLHQVGDCLSSAGEFTAARSWFERAVAEKDKGDVHGRVDHASHGISLHQVGDCLCIIGEFDAARPWFERAVAEAEKGDVHGRIDHASLGKSLHQVGYCYCITGEFGAARPWFERAVAEAEQGDVHGRIDHASLGRSLHQVGYCLSIIGEFGAARPWFERAVAEAEQGDVHGRIDHASLGRSLHQVGFCLSIIGEFGTARPWFERAVAEAEQGDVHGRVDHASLGTSLHQVGACLTGTGEFAAASPWFERAVSEAEQGNVHGQVDYASLGSSLWSLAHCLRESGDLDRAASAEARAASIGG
jgi:tetratricopeptide (TPR) repeat protein